MIKVFLGDLVHNYFYSHDDFFVIPLNIGYLGSYINHLFKDKVEVSLFKYPDRLISVFESNSPDIMGFSSYIWNEELSLQLAKKIKQKSPNTLIVLGGASFSDEASSLTEFLKDHPYIDYVIPIEGEVPFGRLIQAFMECNKDITKLKSMNIIGAATLLIGKLKYTPNPTKTGFLDYPSPYLSGMLDEFLKDPHLYPLFETNRGCPFTCLYCVWGSKTRKKMTQFPIEQVLAELEYVAKKGVNHDQWVFADSNFGMFERDIKIAEKVRELSKEYGVKSVQVWNSKNTIDRNIVIAEIFGSMNGFLVAFQSLDLEVLAKTKRENISMKALERLMKHFKDKEADIETDILCGLPGETYESHLGTLRKCLDYKIQWIRIMNIVLLPGSDLATKDSVEEFKIKTKFRLNLSSSGKYWGDWILDAHEVIISTKDMSEEEMLKLRFVQFFVWLFWNNKILHPLFLSGLSVGVNPIDMILNLIKAGDNVFSGFNELLENYYKDSREEFFDAKKELVDHYIQGNVEKALNDFNFLNFSYAAKIISNQEYLEGIANYVLREIELKSSGSQSSLDFEEIKNFCINRLLLRFTDFPIEKSFELNSANLNFFMENRILRDLGKNNSKMDFLGNKISFKLKLNLPDFVVNEFQRTKDNFGKAINTKFLKNIIYSEIKTN